MNRDTYDDMQYSGERRRNARGRRGNVGLLALFCVLLFLVSLIAYMILSQPKDESVNTSESSVVVDNKTNDNDTVISVKQTELKKAEPDVIKFTIHTVQQGEDLLTIAEHYGLKVQTIISVNRLKNVASLEDGMKLRIPDRDCQLYIVQKGDFLTTIARKFNPNLGWKKLQELNGLTGEMITVGQEIIIPDLPIEEVKVEVKESITFKKPVIGIMTASFGELVDGKPLEGIYYTGSEEALVSAARGGSVIDVGYDPELGRFITLQHEDGYKTTYAFLDQIDVKVGSEVAEGRTIGTITTSSSQTDRPTLYFKIEQFGIALDPVNFF